MTTFYKKNNPLIFLFKNIESIASNCTSATSSNFLIAVLSLNACQVFKGWMTGRGKIIVGVIIAICFCFCSSTIAQKNDPPPGNTAIKEEIQRYIGYETLPARYMSLPYDVTMNSTVNGGFVDISMLFLLLCPIFLLLGFRDKPLYGIGSMGLCLLLLIVSVPNAPIYKDHKALNTDEAINTYLQETSFSEAPTAFIINAGRSVFDVLYGPFEAIFDRISGDYDYITYPLLLLLFVGGFFILQKRIAHHDVTSRALLNFIYLFSFLWLLLTAGIIWYGYLMLALGLLACIAPLSKAFSSTEIFTKYLSRTLGAIIAIWFLMATVFRIGNYTTTPNNVMAKRLYDPAIIQHQAGRATYDQTVEAFFPKINATLDQINQEDESLVYRVGTVLPFFIRKNDRRILTDNQLGAFQMLNKHYPDKTTLASALKASNYKYILVDLNTHTIDKTPEQTLRKKFEEFMQFIHKNPQLKLLTTNRIVRKTINGQLADVPAVFGTDRASIIKVGTYAIYEIL